MPSPFPALAWPLAWVLSALLLAGSPGRAQAPMVVLHSCRLENPPAPAVMAFGTAPLSPGRGPNAAPEVRIIYLVPSDRTVNPAYATALSNAARDLRRWYQLQLGNTKTFDLHTPAVETYQTAHPVAWYQTNPNGAKFSQFYFNAAQDAFAAAGGGSFNNPNYVYAIYIDAESACGQCGGCGGSGVLVVTSNDLKGLVGQPSVRFCPTDPAPQQFPPCRWVGGLGHELGHAFGLPHPPGCDQGLSTCDYAALMWSGYASYPATYLRPDDLAKLNQSAFFKASPPAAAPSSCNNLLASRAAADPPQFSVYPIPAHGTVTVTQPAGTVPLRLALLDALGRAVRYYPVAGNTESTLDLRGVPAGLYVLRPDTGSGRRLVVE